MQPLSTEHIGALIVTAAAATIAVLATRGRTDDRGLRLARGLALTILAAYVGEQLAYAARGSWSPRVNLPLHLTDAVTLVSVAALWRPQRALLVELVYYWALTASVQALLSPDLGHAFPDLLYFTFFVTHGGAVVAACLLVLALGRLPRPRSVWRAYALTAGFTVLAGIGTLATGGNYMYLRRKPESGSLLDVMGPWPWYIASGAAVALAMFLALAALARALRERERGGRGAPPRAGDAAASG